MDINFKHYTVEEFQTKFTGGKLYFNSYSTEVIVFRPEWDDSGLCFVEKQLDAYYAYGCGIEKGNMDRNELFGLIMDSKPQLITDDDIRAFVDLNAELQFTLSLRSSYRESLLDKVIKRFWIQKLYIFPYGELDLDTIEDGSFVGKWWENGKYTVDDESGNTIYEGYDLAKMVKILCSEFK